MMKINSDCVYYIGEKPCVYGRLCDGCHEYKPWKGAICIIKTAAMGDVLRTTSILPALDRKYPGYKITWLTGSASAPLLKGNPRVAEILVMGSGAETALLRRKFDLLICLDKTAAECGLASALDASKKMGFGMSAYGTPVPFNEEAEYFFSLGLSDDLKFKKNKKTYHALIREACGLDSTREAPAIYLSDGEKRKAEELLASAGWTLKKRAIGIVPGAGKVFAHKAPSAQWWARFVELAARAAPDAQIIILGGPDDMPEIAAVRALAGELPFVAQGDVRLYAGVVARMDAIVCGDTMALHAATAFARPTVALFGPTCSAEIDLFGRGEKLVAPLSCAPCYRSECDRDPSCADSIDPARAAKWAASML